MRLMYDSDQPMAIPVSAQMVAGYIDGTNGKWPESAWARFPNAVKVRIARRTTTNDGHVLDVELGIPTVWPPSRAIVDWVLMRRRAGVEPTIYCNQLNDWAGIRKLFTDAGIRQPSWWVARYDGKVDNVPVDVVAKQYSHPPLHKMGHFDLSVVNDYWPGVDGNEEIDMTISEQDANVIWGHKLDFDPNGFPEGEEVPAGGPAWMHVTYANLKATQALTEVRELRKLVAELLAGGVEFKPSGTIVITAEPKESV